MRKNGKKLRIASGVVLAALVGGALFCANLLPGKAASASPAPELLSALPAGAPTLIYIDLVAVRASSFYQHRPDRRPMTVQNKDYADFVQSTGFDFEKDLDRVAVASWGTPTDTEQKRNVLIAEGRFDRPKIRAYMLRKAKLDHQEGREVFLFHNDDTSLDNALTFLDDHRIAFVNGRSIAPLFAAHAGDPADPARERASRVDGAAAFAVMRVPPIPDNFPLGGPGGTQSATFTALLRSIRWVTLAARPEGDDLGVSLEGECDNADSARQLRSTLDVARMFGRSALDDPKSRQTMDPATYSVLASLLSTANITQSEERVSVQLKLTEEVFKLAKKPATKQFAPK